MQPMPPSVGASLWIFPTYAGTGLRGRSSMLPADDADRQGLPRDANLLYAFSVQ